VGYRKVYGAMLNLLAGESRALEAGRIAQAIAHTEVELG
jgi:hypothetical protein